MAIQSQPSRISEPFAGSGTKNVIPATNATPSASQAASWASGFPPECSQPISAGGCPVPRNDVNGVLNQLSQDFSFRQDGGVWEWSALADYDVGRVVRGSDGLLYRSKGQSGPSIAAGAQDPTTDNGTYWTAVPLDNADVVHITGAETIIGAKTFANDAGDISNSSYQHKSIINIGSTVPVVDEATYPDPHLTTQLFVDSNDKALAFFEVIPPSAASHVARLQMGLGNYDCGGDTYSRYVVNLYSSPDSGQYFEAYHLATGAALPIFALLNEQVTKGTVPTGNKWSYIHFCDKDPAGVFGNGDGVLGTVSLSCEQDGGTRMRFSVIKNDINNQLGGSIDLKYFSDGTCKLFPVTSGFVQLGDNSHKWGQLWSTDGTIHTSDARLKTEPESVPDAVLDAWGEVGFVQFQMLDSVEKKGADKARFHNGLIAQRIDEVFKARGLDASRYGLFCWDEWEAEPADIDENGKVVTPALEAGDCYALRYEEALCMEAAYQRRRADRAEARLAALEERLAAIEAKLNA